MAEIKGIVAAMQTPMHEDGSINEAEMRRQINRQIAPELMQYFVWEQMENFISLMRMKR